MIKHISRALRVLTAPLAALVIWTVRGYQKYISPLLPASCKYRPSCSQYMIEALRKKGFVVGFLMGCWRVLRCNPFSRGGYDPVE